MIIPFLWIFSFVSLNELNPKRLWRYYDPFSIRLPLTPICDCHNYARMEYGQKEAMHTTAIPDLQSHSQFFTASKQVLQILPIITMSYSIAYRQSRSRRKALGSAEKITIYKDECYFNISESVLCIWCFVTSQFDVYARADLQRNA